MFSRETVIYLDYWNQDERGSVHCSEQTLDDFVNGREELKRDRAKSDPHGPPKGTPWLGIGIPQCQCRAPTEFFYVR